MSKVELSAQEAGALAYALRRHINHVSKLLGRNAYWRGEQREMQALYWRLRRVALRPVNDIEDIDDCHDVYADDHEFF